ncbi:SDR family NAD(P)-dependent oxidoreductase [Rhizomonospora bruguierae]|uniref:SDR family NAD(P)-dependent oxidoreductase n=1 Tax=Rhizomonospora bruguierae TaxID=1581705 RepID=UPI0020C02275|nr:SDR family NAD(P)-dependent oxidoreductase [Micromonospora sp. NBRC 107566]
MTGSADGIGRRTAADLIRAGHRVVVHGRSDRRADETLSALPDAAGAVVGDLTSLDRTRALAEAANRHGAFDVVIHNAGLGGHPERVVTGDGLERIFQVNVVAPYLLTALMHPPARLVYLTSGLEERGVADLSDVHWERRAWNGMQAYSDSKLYDVVLAFALARRWPGALSNAVDPGWIKTKLGGPNATDELPEGAETQVWLATSDDPAARVTGRYFKRRRDLRANPAAYDETVQEGLLAACAAITGAHLPSGR